MSAALLLAGAVAGAVTGISPCVLPVLPLVLVTSGTQATGRSRWRRPVGVVAGLVVGFAVLTLLGGLLLDALGLPDSFLRWAGVVVLGVVAVAMIVPSWGRALERPFARIAGHTPKSDAAGVLTGLALATLFLPCAGPVLAAISIAGTSHRFSWGILGLTAAYVVGLAIPLLAFAFGGQYLAGYFRRSPRRAQVFRSVGGGVVLVIVLALAFGWTDPLQRAVPGYNEALTNSVNGPAVGGELAALQGESTVSPSPAGQPLSAAPAAPSSQLSATASAHTAGPAAPAAAGPVVPCQAGAAGLANCGPATAFTGISAWLNTTDGAPVPLATLRGQVVLVNFWAFSCINCQHTEPYLAAWYRTYHAAGLQIIGVHTPEFAFERDSDNVRDAAAKAGLTYPIALDNSSATWRAYRNSAWPAQYLVDATGTLRHLQIGEGGYPQTEAFVRQLLRAAHPGVVLPAPTDPAVARYDT